MIPKLLVKEHSGYPAHFPAVSAAGVRPPDHHHFVGGHHLGFMPANVVIQAQNDIDSLLQVHRRKMLRRAANRRSAQLSRARKKAHMEDLKIENARLQKLVDVLDSQPELVFSVNKFGRIAYMSERTSIYMKSSEDSDEDATHINQILSPDSVDAVMDAIRQITEDSKSSDQDNTGPISSVKYVNYNDANGFQAVGYLRCSRVIRRAASDDLANGGENGDDTGPPPKKSKKSSSSNENVSKVPLTAASLAEAFSSSGSTGSSSSSSRFLSLSASSQTARSAGDSEDVGVGRSKPTGSGGGGSGSTGSGSGGSGSQDGEQDEEFVCSIRPADASLPANVHQFASSRLSTASMVKHDMGMRASDDDKTMEERRGSPNGSSEGSNNSSSGNDSSSSKKNSTSSETGSDDNGETESL